MMTNPEDMTEAENAYWEGRSEERELCQKRIAELETGFKELRKNIWKSHPDLDHYWIKTIDSLFPGDEDWYGY